MSPKKNKPRVPNTHEFKEGHGAGSLALTIPAECPYSDHGRPLPLVLAQTCKPAPPGAPEGLKGPALDRLTVHQFSGLSRPPPTPRSPQDTLSLLPPVPQWPVPLCAPLPG